MLKGYVLYGKTMQIEKGSEVGKSWGAGREKGMNRWNTGDFTAEKLFYRRL